jgi:hypothetical protein
LDWRIALEKEGKFIDVKRGKKAIEELAEEYDSNYNSSQEGDSGGSSEKELEGKSEDGDKAGGED